MDQTELYPVRREAVLSESALQPPNSIALGRPKLYTSLAFLSAIGLICIDKTYKLVRIRRNADVLEL